MGEDEDVETVGVVGERTRGAVDALAAAGVATEAGDAAAVLARDIDAVVTVGEPALLAVARERPDVPVLPVEAGSGVRSVEDSDVRPATERLATGAWDTDRHPLLDVDVNGQGTATALMDVMLVTAEPAHISEFALVNDGEAVGQFRADGVVAATPAGTTGYAGAAGAPVIPPGPAVLAVEPVAPFATDMDHWVVEPPLSVGVERDEATVEVVVDDRTVGTVSLDESVTVTLSGWLRTVRVPEGASPFGVESF